MLLTGLSKEVVNTAGAGTDLAVAGQAVQAGSVVYGNEDRHYQITAV